MHLGDKKVIEFTYGEYPRDDPYVGLILAFVSYTPIVSAIVVGTVTLTRRSWHHFCFFCGLVISHASATAIKKIWKQPRPAGAYLSNYGMPSDHSMFMCFITAYLISFMWDDSRLQRRSFHFSSLAIIALSALVCYSRIYLGVHTPEQVAVGVVLGIVLGRIWYDFSRSVLLRSIRLISAFETAHSALVSVFYARRAFETKID